MNKFNKKILLAIKNYLVQNTSGYVSTYDSMIIYSSNINIKLFIYINDDLVSVAKVNDSHLKHLRQDASAFADLHSVSISDPDMLIKISNICNHLI